MLNYLKVFKHRLNPFKMQYLTLNDIKIVVDDDTLEVITQESPDTLNRAELAAIEEISGYLRSKYDCAKAFTNPRIEALKTDPEIDIETIPDTRNKQLLLITTDIMLYHLVSWLPKRLGYEIRETRYLKWLEWLEQVQDGKISPDLPQYTTPDDEQQNQHQRIRFGSFMHQSNLY